jgi:nucleoside-diphosphate kinase
VQAQVCFELCKSGLASAFQQVVKEEFMERTLVIVKPDGVQRGLTGEIIRRFERRGLRIGAMKLMQIPLELAQKLYAVHQGKHFYEGLLKYITSGPVVVMVLEGNDAIEIVRRTMGATNPAEAAPGTIRADFALETGRNLVHGSDSPETAKYEVPLFFRDDEILSYSRDTDRWIFE